MKKKLNSSLNNWILMTGAVLLLLGAVMFPLKPEPGFYVYTVGACAFSFMQFADQYEGHNLIVRRLRVQQVIGGLCLLVTAALMAMQTFQFGFARRNEWLVALTIACVLELYTAFRIPSELDKEKNKSGHSLKS